MKKQIGTVLTVEGEAIRRELANGKAIVHVLTDGQYYRQECEEVEVTVDGVTKVAEQVTKQRKLKSTTMISVEPYEVDLTQMQIDLLKGFLKSEYQFGAITDEASLDHTDWSFATIYNSGHDAVKASGSLASLAMKKIVVNGKSTGKENPATTSLTELGKKIVKELGLQSIAQAEVDAYKVERAARAAAKEAAKEAE